MVVLPRRNVDVGAGDSAVFRVHAESFLRFSEMFANLPEGITYEDYLIVKVRVLEKITKEQYVTDE